MGRCLLSVALFAAAIFSSPAQAADPVTINFWHYQTSNREVLTRAISDFEAENPDVKVRELFKDLSNLASDIQAARLVDRAPDVAQVLGRLTIGMIESSSPVPLDSGPDHGAFLANIAPNFLAVGVYNERPYLVPQSFGTPLLYINRGIFQAAGLDPEKPPRTWAAVGRLCGKL
jgi:ABC-type glycerol-3-phosphate transport system substrate-binding protein